MTTAVDVDWAHTDHANANRAAKARLLEHAAWDLGHNPGDLTDRGTRRSILTAARVKAASDETWALATARLEQRVTWATEHPDHPAAARPEASTIPEEGDTTPEPVTSLDASPLPRGWAALAALPALPHTCDWCNQPAVTHAPDGWRCPDHPPRPGSRDWGAGLDWTPKPWRSCPPRVCWCGRCTPAT